MHRADLSILKNNNHKGFVWSSFYGSKHLQLDTGFSLVEVIAVVLMIGILAAIALPSWSAFVNRQRLNKANDAVLAAIQNAQTEAKKKKLSYSVSFTTDSNIIKTSIYPTTSTPNWQSLDGDLQIPNGAVLLETNIASPNTAGTTYTSVYNATNKSQTITFDYLGTLPNPNFGAIPTGSTEPPGLKIIVAANNVKRCVIVKSLLGAMITRKDSECN
ncbi:type II secretion system protein [Nostocaceae cyanobacterium CENA357]|uniref:Type II secretion system protein n=1 Tax=Atlanticothrix silvestris CENA357 TaxID=1725252 RepID=A0A8J7HM87_9CYAN|nr:type II secretion system protein [Atlanticothrix silvestris]MBH8555075.1 type II secretion system protein [Atlanticothrix silvestris CENA357]